MRNSSKKKANDLRNPVSYNIGFLLQSRGEETEENRGNIWLHPRVLPPLLIATQGVQGCRRCPGITNMQLPGPVLYSAHDTWSRAMSRTKSSWFKWKLTNLTPPIVYTHTSHPHLISQLSDDNKKEDCVCRGLCLSLPVSLLLGKFSYQFVPVSCPPVGVWTLSPHVPQTALSRTRAHSLALTSYILGCLLPWLHFHFLSLLNKSGSIQP